MTIEVTNCKNCPFSEAEFSILGKEFIGSFCLHPSKDKQGLKTDSYYQNYKSPGWCPLKKEDLTIKFKSSSGVSK